MKNKILLKSLILYFLIITKILGNTIEFESDDLIILENGNLIKASKGKVIDKKENIEIEGNKSIYDKILDEVTVIGDVKFFDKTENIYIESEKAIYSKKFNIVKTYGKTYIKVEDEYQIYSRDLTYDKGLMIVRSKEDTTIRDLLNNTYNFEDGFKFETDKEQITSKKTNVIDEKNNNYSFENAKINLLTKEILGKDVVVHFTDELFGDKNNDPKLKGKSIVSNENFTKIYKSVFSTCNLINKNCRDWELESKIFNHDKKKRIFEYKNSWVNLWGKRIMFLPYFHHPDPSVKRMSGFLQPTFMKSDALGRWVHVPYFKVLSDDRDMTFNPRFFLKDDYTPRANKLLFQTEYRRALKDDYLFISDFSINHDGNNRSSHFFAALDGRFNDNTTYKLQLQDVSNDNYLGLHGITSAINNKTSSLRSFIEIDTGGTRTDKYGGEEDDYSLSISAQVFEDLSKVDSDKFQYIFPSIGFTKYVPIDEKYNGNFVFSSGFSYSNHTTNHDDIHVNNDFSFGSIPVISKGILTDYTFMLRNSNSYTRTGSDDELSNYDIYGLSGLNVSYPLKKDLDNSTNFLKPKALLMYSPNNTNDLSTKNIRLDVNRIFSLDRIATSSTVEGGRSLALGLEFENRDFMNEVKYGFNIAQNFRDKKNDNLPHASKLNETRSDIIGNVVYSLNKNFKLDYGFAYDRDLHHSNSDSIGLTLTTNNFVTEFGYISERNDLADSEHITSSSKYNFTDRTSLSFSTARDLNTDFTEYYNLIYNYKTDCLEANVAYKKKYYTDGDIVPDESLFFTLRFIPFVTFNAKDTQLQNY